jgi:hypothetical protein
MVKSRCAELGCKEKAPKAPEHGELVEFLPSARPSSGFLVALAPTTQAKDWLEIGEKCNKCSGFGLLHGVRNHDSKTAAFEENLLTVKRKIDRAKRKWMATGLSRVFECTCPHAAATGIPPLPDFDPQLCSDLSA